MEIFVEIAGACVNSYLSMKTNLQKLEIEDTFTVESILERIYCMNASDYITLIAAIKQLEKFLNIHNLVSGINLKEKCIFKMSISYRSV